ncbi:receptor-like kinase [Rhynchospora pubera]|uniref:Receptor-like kinase n=1 Tax=Rhynchospora pubera TaxID=906938 RepID=A0AAV8ED42_9POAL|nr:receptor-like kinase [Rhynchospora pubera]
MTSSTSLLIFSFLSLMSPHLIVPAFAADSNSTSNSTPILLSCGTSGSIQDTGSNRTWVGDIGSKYISHETSETSIIPYQNPEVPKVPFSAARIFTSNYTYSFPLSPGRYFLRLYFYPTNYSNYLASDSYFTVTVHPYTLLSNFSAFLTVEALNYDYLIQEFSINITSTTLNLTFAPSTKYLNSYAFINGIEIVPSPDLFSLSPAYLASGGDLTVFPYDSGMAFQTMYRLNVGGQSLAPSGDSGGLYRSWDDDSTYIFGAAFGVTFQNDSNVTIEYPKTMPQYIAPILVYETARSMGPDPQIDLNYNLTWILTVDAGFYYLLRFHFCEIQYPITMSNQRVFNIYINNQTAQTQFDVISQSGGIGRPVYEDYVVNTAGSGKMDMWVELHPDTATKPEYYDAILNGLEVFKMSMVENNLAGLNPVPIATNTVNPSQDYGKRHHGSKGNVATIIGGAISSGVLLLSLVGICLLMIYKRQKKKERETEEGNISDSMAVSMSAKTNIISASTPTESNNSIQSASAGTFSYGR